MKSVKILHIGDMQNGFTREDGNLYVPGAQNIIDPTNNFISQVKDCDFDYTFIILDTHFSEEYYQSEEGKLFPIHCEYGTRDWELSINISGLPRRHYLTKNQFDMWSQKPGTNIKIISPLKNRAYDTLFHLIDDPYSSTRSIIRDEFISTIRSGKDNPIIEVTMIGVASDYCIRYAMEGWLVRGARVTIIQDLTKGIEKEIQEVLDEDQYCAFSTDRLRSISSKECMKEILSRERETDHHYIS
jgi:nicotinamidase/pyrazinamidase